MKTLIISNAEIKAITQSNASDSLIAQWNMIATEMMCDILNISDFGVHIVTNERVKILSPEFLQFNEFPVDTSETITLKNDFDFNEISNPPATYYKDPNELRRIYAKDSSDNAFFFGKGYSVLATYTAGYTTQDQIDLSGNISDGETITIINNGVLETWTFKDTVTSPTTQVQIGSDANETLDNFSAKVSGTVSSENYIADLGVVIQSTTSSVVTITNATIPQSLKTCIAYIAAGGIAQNQKIGSVQSYTLGQKTVSFADISEAKFVEQTLKKFAPSFRKINIY